MSQDPPTTPQSKMLSVKKLMRERRWDEAMQVMSGIPADYPLGATDLVIKARLIQMTERPDFTLEDAEKCLRDALALEPENPYVLLDLAFFESRVMDRPAEAQPMFAKAMETLSWSVGECVASLIEAREIWPWDATYPAMFGQLLEDVDRWVTSAAKDSVALGGEEDGNASDGTGA